MSLKVIFNGLHPLVGVYVEKSAFNCEKALYDNTINNDIIVK